MKPLIFWIIVLTESGGVNSAVGDNGKSAGPAQISMAVVADCNRISGRNYVSGDRFDLKKSEEMFLLYTDYYGKRYGVPVSDEVRARIWNGGPLGPSKQATVTYWNKVKFASLAQR